MAYLHITGLGVAFDGVAALRDVSLTVDAHEAVTVLGANGAGKTTLLRAIMGRVKLNAGTIMLDGEPIHDLRTSARVERGLSLCPEGRQIFASMTVEDNLLLGAYRVGGREAARRLAATYEQFAWLRERRTAFAGSFSGGEQQLVAIGRALMAAPRLLLMDEPSSGLSPVAIATIRTILHDVAAAGTAILLVEQNVKLAVDLTQRCYVLNRGVIEAAGPTAELAQDPALADTYLGGASEGKTAFL
jgi:branched-chain amino acid transport system ATP-binding protein